MGERIRKKKLPIGIENFEEIRSYGFYYIDKTGLICDLLDSWGKVNLFTRPRRFGKSLNMSMFKYFFDIGCNPSLFDGLAIAKEADLCEEYMGKFPVISVSLKGVNGSDFHMARSLMCSVIGDEAMRFYYLHDSDRLTEPERKLYDQLIMLDTTGQGRYEMSDATLMGSLKTLSALLEKHHGKKVIILIDEYDVPLAKANEQGYYDEMVRFVRNMFEHALKTNDSLYMSILTGCLRVSRESIFTGLNNFNVLSISDSACDAYFGFTDQEVGEMLAYYELEDKFELIKEWYDGYRFGESDVYCPWDVISYVNKLRANKNHPPQDFWSNTSSNEILKRFLEMAQDDTKSDIERLISGESIIKEIREELTYRELYESVENVFSIMYTTGYLTKCGDILEGNRIKLTIPNREIHNIFMTKIREWMKKTVEEDGEKLNLFCEAFKNAEADTVQTMFSRYLEETVSIRDTAIRKEFKENFYHGFLLGLLRYRGDWIVFSNRESGEGYADIVIEIPRDKFGIVIEVKYPDDGNIEAGSQEALRQIDDKGYTKQPQLDGMKKIMKCGIACHRKECAVRFETE